jgi:hypothetical protein
VALTGCPSGANRVASLNGSTLGSSAVCNRTTDGQITDGSVPGCDCGVVQDGGGCLADACEVRGDVSVIDCSWHYYDAEMMRGMQAYFHPL